MKLILQPNRGSLSQYFDVEGTCHIVMNDWGTGWYKVIVREELPPVIRNGFKYPKFRDLYESTWLKTYEELEAYIKRLEE